MKKYGLRIGDVGVEFSSIEDRDKALRIFTRGADVKISSTGFRYRDGESSFSVYDRDTKEILVNCRECRGIFGTETCNKREYPFKNSWESVFTTKEDYICDGCLVSQEKQKRIFDATKVLNEEEED